MQTNFRRRPDEHRPEVRVLAMPRPRLPWTVPCAYLAHTVRVQHIASASCSPRPFPDGTCPQRSTRARAAEGVCGVSARVLAGPTAGDGHGDRGEDSLLQVEAGLHPHSFPHLAYKLLAH